MNTDMHQKTIGSYRSRFGTLMALCVLSLGFGFLIPVNDSLQAVLNFVTAFAPRIESEIKSITQFGYSQEVGFSYQLGNVVSLVGAIAFIAMALRQMRSDSSAREMKMLLSREHIHRSFGILLAIIIAFFYSGFLTPISAKGLEHFLLRSGLFIFIPALLFGLFAEVTIATLYHISIQKRSSSNGE